jgi:hypothetical protein
MAGNGSGVEYELWAATYGRSTFELLVRVSDQTVRRAEFPLDWAVGEDWGWVRDLIEDASLDLALVRSLTDLPT